MAEEKKQESGKDDKALEEVRLALKECIDEESPERAKMLDDLRFATLDQWPADIRKKRESEVENGPRPCLTVDKISQYIVQIMNDIRQGKPGINVRPQDDAADIETAKILKGVVRNIEDQSNADIAYSVAAESAVKIGLGYFRIVAEYVSEDSFDQELFIRPIQNTFSVYLAKHVMPDGSDAERGFIVESMSNEKFKAMYPKAKAASKDFDGIDPEVAAYWRTTETITVVEEFRIVSTLHTLYFLADGTTMTKEDYDKWPESAGVAPNIQDQRTTTTRQLKWRKLTAVEVLDSRDMPGKYIPIIEVIGREAWVEGRRILWGLVRPAKDSLRMYNYWASAITERMALAPIVPWIAAEGQIEGREKEWNESNRVNRAVLQYKPLDVNGNALPPPQRQGPTPVEAALLQQMQVIEHDVQTSLGMFKAATGESESQQSGRAILALQRESDTGTYHFGANLGIAIRHAGRILIDLIPHYYDTKRVVRIMGEDGSVETAHIDPQQPQSYRPITGLDGKVIKSIYNPGVGKFDVSITVGPSYNTKRMENAATFVELAKGADPMSAAVMHYLTIKNSDFDGSEDAMKMLRALLPPQALQALESGQPIPPEAMAKIQQLTAVVQQMQEQGQKLVEENNKLKAGEQAQIAKVGVDHNAKMKAIELDRQVAAEEVKLARDKASAEHDVEAWKATQKAQLEREAMDAKKQLAREEAEFEAAQSERQRVFDERMTERETTHKMAQEEALSAQKTEQEAESLAPKMMEAMMQQFAKMLKQQNEFNAALIEKLDNPTPRKVILGGIQRNEKGITGATATIN